jgi:two-component system, cell cycle response regulator
LIGSFRARPAGREKPGIDAGGSSSYVVRESSAGKLKRDEFHPTHKFPKVALPVPAAKSPHTLPPGSRDGLAPEGGFSSFPAEDEANTVRMEVPTAIQSDGFKRALPAVLTTLRGLNTGEVFTVDQAETTLGRGKESNVRIDDVGISREHARIVRSPDGHHVLEDLNSTNGVFVNRRRVERATLADGDRIQMGPAVVLRYALIDADELALARQLYETSTRDPLTGAYNRRYLTERLAAEVAYAQRHRARLSLVLLDLDHFKRINDDHGHLAGDAVLRAVGANIHQQTRTEDVFARYGGEEFVVLMRGIERQNVAVFAERLRRSVARLSIPWDPEPLRVTVSLGAASLDECENGAPPDALILIADERLYRSKAEGRNRVSF